MEILILSDRSIVHLTANSSRCLIKSQFVRLLRPGWCWPFRPRTKPPCGRAFGGEIALRQRLLSGLRALGLPITAVPEHDRAAAVLPLRNRPFEVAIIKRMILDLYGEAFVMWIERWTSGYSPGFEDASQLQPQIVVQARSIVLLDDEAATARVLDRVLAARLRRLLKSRFDL